MFTRPRFEFSYVWIAESVSQSGRQRCAARVELSVMADVCLQVIVSFLVFGVI
jgi:hypothetical protein